MQLSEDHGDTCDCSRCRTDIDTPGDAVDAAPFHVVCDASDRAAWLRARLDGITSSEAASALGEDRRRSALALYVAKRFGEVGDLEDEEEPQWLEWGRRLEPVMLEWYRDRTGWRAESEQKLIRSTEYPWLMATLDAWTWQASPADGFPLELKTGSERVAAQWADGVPDYYLPQLVTQMLVTGTRRARILCLFGGQHAGWHAVSLDREDGAIHVEDWYVRRLLRCTRELWERVQSGDPPSADGTDSSHRALYRLHPDDSGEEVALDGELAEASGRLDAVREDMKALGDERGALEARIKEALGKATRGVLPDGSAWSWKTQGQGSRKTRVLRRHAAKESV